MVALSKGNKSAMRVGAEAPVVCDTPLRIRNAWSHKIMFSACFPENRPETAFPNQL